MCVCVCVYNNWYVLCFSVDCLLAGQQTVNWTAQYVLIVVYIQYNSWWWATNMPEHVEVDWWNKLRINSSSSWFLLHRTNGFSRGSVLCKQASKQARLLSVHFNFNVIQKTCVDNWQIKHRKKLEKWQHKRKCRNKEASYFIYQL